ncbi:hypothetical protein [Stenotrophomonas indicatrix]|uniref:hypothetical protein n=1 Tax=Stenotrophomonas indicatrix TaxID=2045451 RepID=UPI000FD9E162|nr:hypothetical protein [Stenotrophomonas indicatrix]
MSDSTHATWIATAGRFQIDDGHFTFMDRGDAPGTLGDFPFGIIRSNIEFEQGSVEFDFRISDPKASVQVAIPGSTSDLYAGVNVMQAPYGFAAFRERTSWEPKGGVGHGAAPILNQWRTMRVAVDGSEIALFVDGVNIVSTTFPTVRGQLSFAFFGAAGSEVRNVSVKTRQPVAFIVMQFTDEFNSLYREVIKPVCENFDYRVVRADEFHTSTMIVDDIIRSLRDSSVVIADITPDNPNVYYEVGYAHALGTPTILLSDRTRSRLPFDVSGLRTIFYNNTIAGKRDVEEALTRHLTTLGDRWTSSAGRL